MSIQKNRRALDESARPKNGTLIASNNTENHRQKPYARQAKNLPAHVIEAKRELLRDYGHEVAIQAADYAGIVANFISADDSPGLQYAAAKFVTFARETAKTCRELIDGRAPL
jgi:hypothetical protein